MSAISDFNSVWMKKFPNSDLPDAWEEDVKTNLAKHKKRVAELQQELEKEQVYVQFLESLLEEVEKRKGESNSTTTKTENSNGNQEQNINDVIKDTLERRTAIASQIPTTTNISSTTSATEASSLKSSNKSKIEPLIEERVKSSDSAISDSVKETNTATQSTSTGDHHLELNSEDDDTGRSGDENIEENSSKEHFVTVIEVNGFEKQQQQLLQQQKQQQQLASSSNGLHNKSNNEETKRLKKVQPPLPPPKKPFQSRPPFSTSETPSSSSSGNNVTENEINSISNSSKHVSGSQHLPLSSSSKSNMNADRPVIFDSRKSSSGNNSSSSSSSHNSGSSSLSMSGVVTTSNNLTTNDVLIGTNNSKVFPNKSHSSSNSHNNTSNSSSSNISGAGGLSKRFEGSKLPLPPPSKASPPQNNLDEKSRNSNSKPHPPSSSSSERENPNNVRSKILDLVNKMESSHKPMALNKNIEQLTPTRSFRKLQQQCSKYEQQKQPQQIHNADMSDYVDPCDAEFDMNNDQIYDSPPLEIDDSPPPTQSSMQAEPERKSSRTSTMESTKAQLDPDVIDLDTDMCPLYDTVCPDQEDDYVMLLEEANQTSSSNNSLSKKDLSLFDSLGGRSAKEGIAGSSSNIDAQATIKSQTSIISGHSIATTTSSGTTSDTDGFSPLPHDTNGDSSKNPAANYVNIDYFLCKSKRKDSRASGESEDEEPALLRAISFDQDGDPIDTGDAESNLEIFDIDAGVYANSVDSLVRGDSKMGQSSGVDALTMTAAEQEKFAMFRYMVSNIAESESAYVEVLNVMLKYMTALKATLATSKPVLSTDDFNIIFYKIPELFSLHQKFLLGLQQQTTPNMTVGKHFEHLARDIGVYGAFLQNYSRAVDTVRKCGQNSSEFAEITRSIRLRSLNKNQVVSLETLLYSPVSRVQKNIEIITDLLKCLPETHPDHNSLKCALREFQSFLAEFKMIQPEQLFHGQGDRSPRHLVKNSFIVELSEGHRKLRHLFLFNDVLVCAKYKASGKGGEKFTFELKWYIMVSECQIVEESTEPRESAPINLVALRSQASTVRDQIKRQTSRDDPKKAKAEKQRKKLAELEAQLVLASPNLVFKVKGNGRAYTFFLSSEYERSQWVDAIETLKSGQVSPPSQLGMHELQSWLTSCRKHLKTNMGSYLLRTGRDENLLVGDFYILINKLSGVLRPADLYICVEVDSYGHFFRKAKTKMICGSCEPCWNQDFVIELEGAQNLRILLYEDHPRLGTLIRAKTTIELNRNWLTTIMSERKIDLQDYVLTISTKYVPAEMTIRRVPTAKPSGLYGAKIAHVCRREQRKVPFIMTSCVREVERRGINEVGIYRVSGSASDVSRLKKAFETNSYEAEQLLKEVDIHSVTGALKMYMRELPEALFTDELYPRFFEAFNLPEPELKRKTLLQLFSTLPPTNQHIITFLLDHMTRVNSHENHNKMSLHNIATVFGPTLLRPGARNEGSSNIDLLAAGTVDVMAQSGILYFFLQKRASGELQILTSQ